MPNSRIDSFASFMESFDTTNLFFAMEQPNTTSDEGPTPSFKVKRADVAEELADEFAKFIRDWTRAALENVSLKNFDLEYKLDDHELFAIDLSEWSGLQNTLDHMQSVEQPEPFERDSTFGRNAEMYFFMLQNANDNTATFYRRRRLKKVASRGRLTAWTSDSEFDTIRSDAYVFDDKIDFFRFSNRLYVAGKNAFVTAFRIIKDLRSKVDSNLDTVTANVSIQNEHAFRKACKGSPAMISKLAHAASRPYINDLKMNDLVEVINEFDLDIDIVGSGNDCKLVFDDTFGKQWPILKLFDDDYLGSMMTDEKYEVNSKTQRS